MIAAGMDGALPMSFGSSRQQPRKRKRENRPAVDVKAVESIPLLTEAQAEDESNDDAEEEAIHGSNNDAEALLVNESDATAESPKVITKVVDKLHVKYDSDGEITDRVLESVMVVETELPPKLVTPFKAADVKEIMPKRKKLKCPGLYIVGYCR